MDGSGRLITTERIDEAQVRARRNQEHEAIYQPLDRLFAGTNIELREDDVVRSTLDFMVQAETTLTMWRGAVKNFDVFATHNGVAQDITNWTVYMTAKVSIKDLDPGVFQIRTPTGTTPGDISIVSATGGQIGVRIPPAVTSPIDNPVPLVWDVKGIAPNGDAHVLHKGVLNILEGVTRTG